MPDAPVFSRLAALGRLLAAGALAGLLAGCSLAPVAAQFEVEATNALKRCAPVASAAALECAAQSIRRDEDARRAVVGEAALPCQLPPRPASQPAVRP